MFSAKKELTLRNGVRRKIACLSCAPPLHGRSHKFHLLNYEMITLQLHSEQNSPMPFRCHLVLKYLLLRHLEEIVL